MVKELRKNLYLIYMIATGLILTVVIAAAAIVTIRQLAEGTKTEFQNQVFNVFSKIQNDNEVKYSWIAENEVNGRMIIYIEDNGRPLNYPGSWKTDTDREILVKRLKETILKYEEKDFGISPITSSEYQSKMYELKGDNDDRYYGQGIILKVKGGYRSISMLKSKSGELRQIQKQLSIYLAVYVSGLLALAFMSRILVDKSVAPVEANRKKQTEFIAAVSHELRSPLAVICAGMAVMEKEQVYIPKFADSVDRECKRMARLTDDMLLLASTDAERFQVNMDTVDTDSVLVDIYEEFSQICGQNRMKFELLLQDDELPKIAGDEERIRQILNILLNNAIRYSGGNECRNIPEIGLRAYADKNGVLLEFMDHGNGITDKDKEKIFERFYRADKSRNDKMHFGLGLSIAKELMDLHGGSIAVRDTDGGGATFVMRFQRVKE